MDRKRGSFEKMPALGTLPDPHSFPELGEITLLKLKVDALLIGKVSQLHWLNFRGIDSVLQLAAHKLQSVSAAAMKHL